MLALSPDIKPHATCSAWHNFVILCAFDLLCLLNTCNGNSTRYARSSPKKWPGTVGEAAIFPSGHSLRRQPLAIIRVILIPRSYRQARWQTYTEEMLA